MKIRKQQDTFRSGKILNELLHQVSLKRKVQKEIEKTQKIQNQLFLNLQQLDNHIVAYQNLFLGETIRRQKKKEDYRSADEIVEYLCINANPQMAELTVEEVAAEVMERVDMNGSPSTIDQILSDDETINVDEQALDKENTDPEEEPEILYQLKVGDLIEKKINYMYN